MRIAECLSYSDINQLRSLGSYYSCEITNSKHEMIKSILCELSNKSYLVDMIDELAVEEARFLEVLSLDLAEFYTMEELLAKGRASLGGVDGQPRKLIVSFLRKGWLFSGHSPKTRYLYHMPSDIKENSVSLLKDMYMEIGPNRLHFKNEEGLLNKDLKTFLGFIQDNIVQLTSSCSIYRPQQKQIFNTFQISEDTLSGKGPRFGFGRSYHLYPDRFALLYDYAFYNKYIGEENGILSLSNQVTLKMGGRDCRESTQLFHFWVRLYRRPIPSLPLLLRFVFFLCRDWCSVDNIFKASSTWINPFYYEGKESILNKVVKMLVHLGVVSIGTERETSYIKLTEFGFSCLSSRKDEKVIEEEFIK